MACSSPSCHGRGDARADVQNTVYRSTTVVPVGAGSRPGHRRSVEVRDLHRCLDQHHPAPAGDGATDRGEPLRHGGRRPEQVWTRDGADAGRGHQVPWRAHAGRRGRRGRRRRNGPASARRCRRRAGHIRPGAGASSGSRPRPAPGRRRARRGGRGREPRRPNTSAWMCWLTRHSYARRCSRAVPVT
jgi:hypothetical protein